MVARALGSWICASCAQESIYWPSTSIRSYVTRQRPSNQRLSRDVAGRDPPKYNARADPRYQYRSSNSDVQSRSPRPVVRSSSGRMSKTGTSVLQPIPIHERTESKSIAKKTSTFENLRLSSNVLESIRTGALKNLEYVQPTAIQSLTIPSIIRSAKDEILHSYLVAAETGSGKTLAYLAPILHLLKDEEISGRVQTRQIGKPRCIILLPSVELVKQVGALVKAMSYGTKVSSTVILPEYDFRRTKNQVLMNPVDILITLPFRLSNLLEERLLSLAQTRHFVIDEADTLLDVSFADIVRPLISAATNLSTLVFCSATIPRSVDAYLRNNYPDIERLVSSKIHSIPRRIATKFVDVAKDFNGDKEKAVHQILRDLQLDTTEPGKIKKVILFVNKREDVKTVADFINSKGITALPFSRDIAERDQNIRGFLLQEAEAEQEGEQSSIQVLITTDLASRGIDTTTVKNVIIYDTPHSTIDLLHRIGRTGRAGRRGTAYILLGKKRGEKWIEDVKKLSIQGQPLI